MLDPKVVVPFKGQGGTRFCVNTELACEDIGQGTDLTYPSHHSGGPYLPFQCQQPGLMMIYRVTATTCACELSHLALWH